MKGVTTNLVIESCHGPNQAQMGLALHGGPEGNDGFHSMATNNEVLLIFSFWNAKSWLAVVLHRKGGNSFSFIWRGAMVIKIFITCNEILKIAL